MHSQKDIIEWKYVFTKVYLLKSKGFLLFQDEFPYPDRPTHYNIQVKEYDYIITHELLLNFHLV